jgi:copper chaperone
VVRGLPRRVREKPRPGIQFKLIRGVAVQTEIMKITGMHCGGCTGKVTRALKAVVGVTEAKVSLTPGEATVQYDERAASPGQLKTAVEAAGYGVVVTGAANSPKSKSCCCGSKNASATA